MTAAKEFLKQYEYADRRVRRLEREYEEERLMIDAVRSLSDLDGMPHGSNIGRPTEVRAVRLADKLAALKDARMEAVEARQTVFNVIDNIPGIEGDILYARYIELLKWDSVARSVHASTPTVYKYHKLALEAVERVIILL